MGLKNILTVTEQTLSYVTNSHFWPMNHRLNKCLEGDLVAYCDRQLLLQCRFYTSGCQTMNICNFFFPLSIEYYN